MSQATATAFTLVVLAGCASRGATESTSSPPVASVATPMSPTADASLPDADVVLDAGPDASVEVHPLEKEAIDGPHEELSLDAGRSIYYALPKDSVRPLRLIGHIHGICGPPSYACGKWIGAGTAVGLMVCPTGNAKCGDSPYSPPSWEAPSWAELVGIMDADLEASIAKVSKKKKAPEVFTREGSILTGYSRGAFAAPAIAKAHPGRWQHLVLIEANVPLSATGLHSAGVKSVALVAGDQGDQIQGMRKTEAALIEAGYPVQLFVMHHTGHPYSPDMEDVMASALSFVLNHD